MNEKDEKPQGKINFSRFWKTKQLLMKLEVIVI